MIIKCLPPANILNSLIGYHVKTSLKGLQNGSIRSCMMYDKAPIRERGGSGYQQPITDTYNQTS